MANFHFTVLALPWVDLPDSLDTLTTLAAQIQTVISSAMRHPLWAIAAILLTLVLLQIVADLVKRILKASLTFMLKLPLRLSQWLWQKATQPAHPPQVAQVDQLLSRLETLREEQDQVMAELKALLSSSELRLGSGESISELSSSSSISRSISESGDDNAT